MAERGDLDAHVAEFIRLVQGGKTVEAIERFYAPDVIVFENRQRVRAGRKACVDYETEQLAASSAEPAIKVLASAVNARTGHAFLEYQIRFISPSGKPMLLEEVACQRWEQGLISQERFHYAGLVDESDGDDGDDEAAPA